MHLILTGATGLVGSAALNAMINMPEVSGISVLSRRPVKMAEDAKDPRINIILHHDFTKYGAEVLAQLKGASGLVWALGTGQNAVSREEYVNITTTFAVKAAEAISTLASNSHPFRFVFVSGDGATFEPGPFTPLYARVKGETEMALAEVSKAHPQLYGYTVRPGFVDLASHDAIKPYVPPRPILKQTAITLLGPVYRTALPSRCSPSQPLGKFLVEVAMGKWDKEIGGPGFQSIEGLAVVGNHDFRRLSGLNL